MPEGDTIYRTARTLAKVLEGKPIRKFTSQVARIGTSAEEELSKSIITRVEARGKNLLMHFSNGWLLHTHMMMTGSWHIYRPGEKWRKPRWQARVIIETEEFVAICFNAPVVELNTKAQSTPAAAILASVGPDLVADREYDSQEVLRRIRVAADQEIGVALLNQKLMAGIGNIYKSEALFAEKISPFRKISDLDDPVILNIVKTASNLLKKNASESLRISRKFWVYRRSGKACFRCRNMIRMTRQGPLLRSTYYCETCQK